MSRIQEEFIIDEAKNCCIHWKLLDKQASRRSSDREAKNYCISWKLLDKQA